MPELTGTIGIINKIKSADIQVYPHRCVTVRNRNATCRRCAAACTSGAISLNENELVIDPDKCIGCGTCATMCPTCALEARRPNDAELFATVCSATAANNGVAVLACHQIVDAAMKFLDSSKLVGVECLGRVEESLIVNLAARGAKKVILVKGNCAECDHNVGLDAAQQVVETANALLDVWNSPCRAEISERFPKSVRVSQDKGFDENRRNFFFRAKDDASFAAGVVAMEAAKSTFDIQDLEAPKYIKVMDDGTLPHFLPDRRERLLDGLAALGEPRDELVETRLWGHVMIEAEKCQSCRMCATFCPTGAIVKFDDPDGSTGVDHFPGDCVKCRCCEDICPKDALTISDEVFAVDLLTGAVERIEMPGRDPNLSGSKKAQYTMRNVLNFEEIYDR